MKNTKSTKRALLSAILALVMTVSMLVGTTFAWFTDSVTSSGNKIVAGNLDVELYLFDGTDYVNISKATQPIFGEGGLAAAADGSSTIWEPGKTQVAYLAIKNAGTLALKYQVSLNVTGIENDLNEALSFTITPDARGGSVTEWDSFEARRVNLGSQLVSDNNVAMQPGDMHYFALSVHMDEEAGNKYMEGTISFDITVLAAQLGSEKDSLPDYYDSLATYDDGGFRIADTVLEADTVSGEAVTVENEEKTLFVNATAGDAGKIEASVSAGVAEDASLAVASAAGLNLMSYDIKVSGQQDGSEVEVSLFIGKSLMGISVFHNGVAMAAGDYDYNPETGFITIVTADFSTFDVTFTDCDGAIGSFEDLNAVKGSDGSYALSADFTADNIIHFGQGVENVLDLNGKTVTAGNPGQYIIGAQQGSILTINGNGTVDAGKGFFANKGGATIVVNGGDYTFTKTGTLNKIAHTSVAQNNSKIVINGGTFKTDVDNAVLFFATSNARIEINGGFFENTADKTPDLLGIGTNKDNTNRIVITGGTFVNYNPLEDKMTYTGAWPEAGEAGFGGPWMLIPGGYTVVSETQANGDVWYSVVPVQQ